MNRSHINPLQWHFAVGVARQICAGIFRDGGTPADALKTFGLPSGDQQGLSWSKTVDVIADRLCAGHARKAA